MKGELITTTAQITEIEPTTVPPPITQNNPLSEIEEILPIITTAPITVSTSVTPEISINSDIKFETENTYVMFDECGAWGVGLSDTINEICEIIEPLNIVSTGNNLAKNMRVFSSGINEYFDGIHEINWGKKLINEASDLNQLGNSQISHSVRSVTKRGNRNHNNNLFERGTQNKANADTKNASGNTKTNSGTSKKSSGMDSIKKGLGKFGLRIGFGALKGALRGSGTFGEIIAGLIDIAEFAITIFRAIKWVVKGLIKVFNMVKTLGFKATAQTIKMAFKANLLASAIALLPMVALSIALGIVEAAISKWVENHIRKLMNHAETSPESAIVEESVPADCICTAARGGFFSFGQPFIARETGPELVGTIGRRNAVVNNDQIVESISRGVYSAVREAMTDRNSKNNQTLEVNLYLDGKQITSAVEKVQRERGISIMNNNLSYVY